MHHERLDGLSLQHCIHENKTAQTTLNKQYPKHDGCFEDRGHTPYTDNYNSRERRYCVVNDYCSKFLTHHFSYQTRMEPWVG